MYETEPHVDKNRGEYWYYLPRPEEKLLAFVYFRREIPSERHELGRVFEIASEYIPFLSGFSRTGEAAYHIRRLLGELAATGALRQTNVYFIKEEERRRVETRINMIFTPLGREKLRDGALQSWLVSGPVEKSGLQRPQAGESNRSPSGL